MFSALFRFQIILFTYDTYHMNNNVPVLSSFYLLIVVGIDIILTHIIAIMKFRLNHRRSKSKVKGQSATQNNPQYSFKSTPLYRSNPNPAPILPASILKAIFAHVCPHAQDDTYVASEDSMKDGGCMLCDMRDLAQCALVSRRWYEASSSLL